MPAGHLREGGPLQDRPVLRLAVPRGESSPVLRTDEIVLLERVARDVQLAAHGVRGLEVRLLAGGDLQRGHEVKQLHHLQRSEVHGPQRAVHAKHVHAARVCQVLRHTADAHGQQPGDCAHDPRRRDDVGPDHDGVRGGVHHAVRVHAIVRRHARHIHVLINRKEARALRRARVGHAKIRNEPQAVRPRDHGSVAALGARQARLGLSRQGGEHAAHLEHGAVPRDRGLLSVCWMGGEAHAHHAEQSSQQSHLVVSSSARVRVTVYPRYR